MAQPPVTTGTATCPMHQADDIIKYIRGKLLKKHGSQKPFRAAHAKTIGLAKAIVRVNKDLDPGLRKGLFEEERNYEAWVRFTNGSADKEADARKAVRGMAIKILGVRGERYMNDSVYGETQDMILFSSPISVPGKINAQHLIPRVILGNKLEQVWAAFLGVLSAGAAAVWQFFNKGRIVTPNILEERYWSATPYCFGDRAIKWLVLPLKTETSLMPESPHADFLRLQLIKDLWEQPADKEEIAFTLLVQFQQDPKTEPLDDPGIEWKTEPVPVATILLPKQQINTPEIEQKDVDMNFSPGYAIQEHAPLGEVNKLRIQVYEQLAKERREHP